MNNNKLKILVVFNHDSTWVKDDIKILKKYFDVSTFYYKKEKSIKDIKKLIKECDIVFIWFASYHGLKATFFAKKYQKKIITVASGYSVANLPEYNYGLASKFYTKWIPKYILANSNIIIAVSESNKNEIIKLVKNKDKINIIYHGFDADYFKPNPIYKKEKKVITVAGLDKISWKRKGIDKFVEIASFFPNISFIVIGKIKDDVKDFIESSPNNVIFTDFVSDNELLEYYQKSMIYAQFSFHEGFGCTVAEAMLCKCIPIVTMRGSLPEVVGNYGYKIPYWNIEKAKNSLEQALNSNNIDRKNARKWIKSNFLMIFREKNLIELINRLME